MQVLTRPEPAVALPERPPERQTAPTRVEVITRPALESAIDRAVSRILRAIYMSAVLFAASVALTTWWLRQ